MKIIALEESFWYEKLATEGSTLSHVRVKSAVAADWQRKLVDFTEYRLPDMDRNGVDMQVLSLTSPGIQVQPDPDIAVADARTANDFLADIIKEHPQRFTGLAAIPLQDPLRAAAELRGARYGAAARATAAVQRPPMEASFRAAGCEPPRQNILLIPGTRTRAHLAQNLDAADVELDDAARAELTRHFSSARSADVRNAARLIGLPDPIQRRREPRTEES
jgi:hypothetical protein